MSTRTMKSCFPWAWLTWAPRRGMRWLKSFLWVGCWDLCSLPDGFTLSNKGSAQHGSFFLSRSRASLFYLCLPAQTLRELAIFETATLYQIQLELDNALKSYEAYTHRYKYTPCEHEIHVFAGSAGRHVKTAQNQVLKEWKRWVQSSWSANSLRWMNHNPLRISATEKVLREGQSLRKEGENNMVLQRN